MINIKELMNAKEKVNLEVKAAQGGIPKSIWESYSAFANTFGGTILLGVDEDKQTNKLTPIGISNPQKMTSDIWNTLNNHQTVNTNILLDHNVYTVEYEGKNIVVIEVPRAERKDKPVYAGSDMFTGTYRRAHEGDYHCSKEEIKAMLRDQSDTSQDSLVLDELEISELNQESVHRYRTMFNNEKPSHIWSSLNDAEFLTKIGAARKSQLDGKIHPTLAGLIFFGDYITIVQTLPNYFLDYREKLSDTTRWSDRVCASDGDWSGNIFDFYFKIYNRLTADVKKPFALDENQLRIDDTSVHKSIRECLANSLIHADYYGRRGIVINKEYQKITFTNPGTFRISLEDAIAGGISDVRNASIFNMFSLIHVGERSGTGLCDVFHVWEESGFSKPTISETVNPEQITVELEIHLDDSENNDNYNGDGGNLGGNGGNLGGDGGNLGGDGGSEINSKEYTADLSQLEKNVLAVISKSPDISVPKLALAINTPKRTVERALQSLRNKSYIRREGSTRGRWIILK